MAPKRWHEVNEMDVGDVSEFETPSDTQRVCIRLPIGTTIRVGEEVMIDRNPVKLIKDAEIYCYRVVSPERYKGIHILSDTFEPILNENVENDLGDTGDYPPPPDTLWAKILVGDKRNRVVRINRDPIKDNFETDEHYYQVVGPREFQGNIVAEDNLEILDEGVEDDLGNMDEFEEPPDFQAVKIIQRSRGKYYSPGDIFLVEINRDGNRWNGDDGEYAYRSFRKVFPDGTHIPCHSSIADDDAEEIPIPESLRGGDRYHTVYKRTTESIEDELGYADNFEKPEEYQYPSDKICELYERHWEELIGDNSFTDENGVYDRKAEHDKYRELVNDLKDNYGIQPERLLSVLASSENHGSEFNLILGLLQEPIDSYIRESIEDDTGDVGDYPVPADTLNAVIAKGFDEYFDDLYAGDEIEVARERYNDWNEPDPYAGSNSTNYKIIWPLKYRGQFIDARAIRFTGKEGALYEGMNEYDIRFKETTMEKRKRWHEANEVSPESGYIKEVPDPLEDLGDVGDFPPPEVFEDTKILSRAPSYFDAWKYFSTHYREFADQRAGIPHGEGAFEMWWIGGPCQSNCAPSPEGTITKEDIDKLMHEGPYQYRGGGEEVFGLFMNTYYNYGISTQMDNDTLVYLARKAMVVATNIGGEEEFDSFDIFKDVDDEEKEELMGSLHAAKQIVAQIRREAQAELEQHAIPQ